ncbi:unnamed protein product [Ostreobium quekettii]|uniref:Uncharacterized protein n=1 Tax=Ostreobium quekettii TaxID=121088 RepID=A0A8S1IR84_9CHLO|nr:unnamed protein product [Ostreobium quekettii]
MLECRAREETFEPRDHTQIVGNLPVVTASLPPLPLPISKRKTGTEAQSIIHHLRAEGEGDKKRVSQQDPAIDGNNIIAQQSIHKKHDNFDAYKSITGSRWHHGLSLVHTSPMHVHTKKCRDSWHSASQATLKLQLYTCRCFIDNGGITQADAVVGLFWPVRRILQTHAMISTNSNEQNMAKFGVIQWDMNGPAGCERGLLPCHACNLAGGAHSLQR